MESERDENNQSQAQVSPTVHTLWSIMIVSLVCEALLGLSVLIIFPETDAVRGMSLIIIIVISVLMAATVYLRRIKAIEVISLCVCIETQVILMTKYIEPGFCIALLVFPIAVALISLVEGMSGYLSENRQQ